MCIWFLYASRISAREEWLVYFVLAIVAVVLAIVFWRSFTAPFLRKKGRTVHFDSAIEPLGLVLDFLKAIFARSGGESKMPIGVYFHGVFLVLTAIFLIIAWS